MQNSRERQQIERAIAGDQAALTHLLLDNYEPLRAYVSRKIAAEIQAITGVDDLVQQVYAQVFRDITRFTYREDSSLLAWLKTIADHRLRDCIRAQRRKKRGGDRHRVVAGLADHESPLCDLLEYCAVTSATPSRTVAREEAINAIHLALGSLPDEHRRAIQLRYFDEMPVDAIARVMGKSPGAIRGLLERAKSKLRDALQSASHYLSTR